MMAPWVRNVNPGCIVKFRPLGPWRFGPDSGARDRVDTIYHSDSLYSAVTGAISPPAQVGRGLGPDKKVFGQRYVPLGTIQEKSEQVKEKKRGLVAAVMEAEGGGPLKMSMADIEALFAPDGQTEGQINRLKMLKRSMYGRAGVELLRARMLPYVPCSDHTV